MQKGLVVCGFPGVGKSHLFRNRGDEKITDSDSSQFDKAFFPSNYIAHIKEKLADGYIVMCSTHDVVREALADEGIKYLLVYPKRKCKAEYIQRYIDRGSPAAFVKLIDGKWDDFVASCEAPEPCSIHMCLDTGVYIPSISTLRAIAANVIYR